MIQRAAEMFSFSSDDLSTVFFQGDACSFELPNKSQVDAIFSNAALHWVLDAETSVATMSRILKPGGRFVVEFGGKGNIQLIADAAVKALSMHGMDAQRSPWYFPSIGEYTSILERHGIEVTNAVLFDRPTVLEDGENGLANWLQMFAGPLLGSREQEEQERIVNEILDILRPTSFNGTHWTADYRRIRIFGRKIA
jgi:trans-aconitate 2-methyltransferase